MKDFWNLLREDFKNSLMFYNPNLNYVNKYRFERDLLKENVNDQINTPLNLNQEIAKSIQGTQNKILFYEKKLDGLKQKISKLKRNRFELIEILKERIQSRDKRYFQTLKAIKALNQELRTFQDSVLRYTQDIMLLRERNKELNYERLSYKNEYGNLAKKQAYLHFLESQSSRVYNQNDVQLKAKIKNDLRVNAQNLAQHFEQNIKTDLILSRTLNKKTNAFSMISLVRDLDSHLLAIAKLDASADLHERLQSYERILKQNKKLIIHLCEQKLENLNAMALKGEKSMYRQKELRALQLFLNKPIANNPSLSRDSLPAQENKTNKHNPNQGKINDLEIDSFLRWYCKKQDIRNVGLYELSLKEKIKNGAFENFEGLYKEFNRDKSKGMER